MRLRSIEVTNFRSIRGTVACDLDASVVLVYGSNGAGKTSMLSAIEYGLTGAVSSLADYGDAYPAHLLHSGTDSGSVSLTITNGELRVGTFSLTRGTRSAEPLLAATDRDFLRERAYLAQSTMARLLETYEQSDRRGDSALARFVNELLGLESLDALISGLEPARDIRRIRKQIPEFSEAEAELTFLRKRLKDTQADIARTKNEQAALSQRRKALGQQRREDAPTADSAAALLRRAQSVAADFEEIMATQQMDFVKLEAELHATSERISSWIASAASAYEHLLVDVIKYAEVDLTLSAEPGSITTSLEIAERLVSERLSDARARMDAHRASQARLAPLEEQIDVAHASVMNLNAEVAELALGSDAAGLADALASIGEYIEGDACPVCGRDFAETHQGALSVYLGARIAQLGEVARQVASLGERRTKQQSRLDDLTRERQKLVDGLESPQSIETLRTTATAGNDLLARVQGGRPSSDAVSRDLVERERLEALLSASRSSADKLVRLRRDLFVIATEAGLAVSERSTLAFADQVQQTLHGVQELHETAQAAVTATNERIALEQEFDDRSRSLGELREVQSSLNERISAAQSRLSAAQQRVDSAVSLSKEAVELRTKIVEQVFDSELNGTWRDLFTRLAPEEPYVPEFVASDGPRRGISLRAVHKQTGTAGAPGLVLSAGNLNTAALTLFLSLNATARSDVEVLLLDDPVQAMDDIHVAQFSALLRSFTRDLGRQVVIAIHERSLFDYLSLELAPANVGESLVTIELARSSASPTNSQVRRFEYRADPIETGLSAA